jgi:hypothetical protein
MGCRLIPGYIPIVCKGKNHGGCLKLDLLVENLIIVESMVPMVTETFAKFPKS